MKLTDVEKEKLLAHISTTFSYVQWIKDPETQLNVILSMTREYIDQHVPLGLIHACPNCSAMCTCNDTPCKHCLENE